MTDRHTLIAFLAVIAARSFAVAFGKLQPFVSHFPSCSRFIDGVEHADVVGSTIIVDATAEPPVHDINAVNPCGAIRRKLPVSHVLGMGRRPEIGDSVLRGHAVDVVKPLGILAGCHLPYNAVRKVPFAANLAIKITELRSHLKGWLVGISAIPACADIDRWEHIQRPSLPKEKPGFRITYQKLVEGGQIWQSLCSHGAVLSRFGQGRRLLAQLFRPAFYSRMSLASQGVPA